MFIPKRTKFRKYQKGTTKAVEGNRTTLKFGRYAIQSLESTRLKSSTIEAVRRTITRQLKRTGQVWIRIFPDFSVTAKALQARMGKGKGGVSYWACRIKAGQILYEIDGVKLPLAKQAAILADSKLPIKTQFLQKD